MIIKKPASRTKNPLVLSIFLLFFSLSTMAQKVVVDQLPFKSYEKNVSLPSELATISKYPPDFRTAKGIVTNASTYEMPDSIIYIKNIKDEWIQKNHPSDNEQTSIKYGLVKINNGYFVKRFNTEVIYGVVVIGGGTRIQRYLKILDNNFSELICLFNDSTIKKEYPVSLTKVNVPELMIPNTDILFSFADKQFKNNIKLSFKFNNSDYSILYQGDLCKGGISGKGFGTILPIYINVQITLVNNSQNKEQYIFQMPNGQDFSLIGITYGDINKDNELDVILSVLWGAYKLNLVYLSSKNISDKLVYYLGYYEVDCIDP
jgi:hypothetical protein